MEYLTKKELAGKLKLSTRTIDRHRASGLDLGAIKIGHRIRFDQERAKRQLDRLAEAVQK
jgi:hypothetical protein